MLTSRGWWFLLIVLAVLTVAGLIPPDGHPPLALVALTLLTWFLVEWLLFAIRARGIVSLLLVEREIRDERGNVESLWAGRSFEVRLRLRLHSYLRLPFVLAADFVPVSVDLQGGSHEWQGELRGDQPVELSYRITCRGTGIVRFEGVTVRLADLQGFFHFKTFRPAVEVFRVLPVLMEAKSLHANTKDHNLLPPPGIHRLRRPGSGSELLDLRDYLPGDPPKTIAWKVSARRDRLITKEFESDVPIRCTLFVDTSRSVRVGPSGQNALARIVAIAATVAQASNRNRDPFGLALCDEERTWSYLRPARTRRHLTQSLALLADAAGLAPTTGEANVDELLPLAHGLAQEIHPELLRGDVNAFPFWLPWLKPRSVLTMAHPKFADYANGLMPLLVLAYTLAALGLGTFIWSALARWLTTGPHITRGLIAATLGFAAFAIVMLYLRGMLALFPARRRAYRWRKQMAALLSARYGLAPGGIGLLLEDDRQCAHYLQRYLAEHQVPMPLPLYDSQGRYLFAAPRKIGVLAQVLLQAVGKGHDNELFVLLADLLELTEELNPLLRAVKVALARHHQVLVVCPWPPGIEPPKWESGKVTQLAGSLPQAQEVTPRTAEKLIEQAIRQRFHRAFFQVRRTFARLGVSVICAEASDSARLTVERMDRLRTLRTSSTR